MSVRSLICFAIFDIAYILIVLYHIYSEEGFIDYEDIRNIMRVLLLSLIWLVLALPRI